MGKVLQRMKISVVGAAMAATVASTGAVIVVGTAIAAAQSMTTTTAVNLRSGPGTNYGVLTVVPAGATVTATGTTSGSWRQVTYSGKTGYMSGTYLKAAADSSGSTSGATGTATTTSSVNVRTGPSTGYRVVGVASSGTKVTLTGVVSGTWSQVVWQGSNRWISSNYLSTSGSSSSTTTYGKVKTTANLNMRTKGDLSGTVLGVLPANSIVDVTGETTDDYTEILYQGNRVWIWSKYVTEVSSSPEYLSSTTKTKQQKVVSYALSKVGGPYVWGGEGPTGFDCSGLTLMAYRQIGISLPHYSGSQANLGTPVSKANLQPGDLIFWYSPVSHVSMYIGDGMMVHARNTTVGIVTQSVDSYLNMGAPWAGARRFIN